MKSFTKFIICSLILSIIANIIYFKFINKSDINQLLGYTCLKVLTGSMEPEIKAGENIIIKKCKQYEIGDIITYSEKDGDLVTHRIVSIQDELYYTKGDANNIQDLEPVSISQIYGKVILHFNSFFDSLPFSYAKYIYSNKASVNVKIANPIFIVEGDKEILIEKYGSTSDYNFIVKNYNEINRSDVSFNYNIDIIADDIVKTRLFCDGNLVDISNTFTLSHNTSIKHEYLLKIEAPEDYYGKVKINVSAYQVEEGMS